ncbi:MAG TPA: ubiquinone/menaquinone biosynthesis methyltransferase [Blastocatellia bacterium]|nr:ubiquinone/menaquinone biosynthesis methyltransferase [Blastocatellia bacterium]
MSTHLTKAKPDLKEHITSKEKKQGYVTRMFDIIAPRYDFITSFLSYGMDRGWKRVLIRMAELKGHETVLDLACGTGDITFGAAARLTTGRAAGLDITHRMLQIADRKRRMEKLPRVAFHEGDICSLPYENESFDVVTGGYSLRNVPDLETGLLEIRRVLRPGGRALLLDFGHPPNAAYRWLYFRYLTVVGSGLGLALHGDPDTYRYIPESLKLYPGQIGVKEKMSALGFTDVGFRQFGGGIMAINYGRRV